MDLPGGSVVKNPPTNAETQVRSLGLKDHPEKEKKSHGQRSLVGYGPWDGQRVGHDLAKKHQQLMDLHSFDKYFLSFYFMAVSLLNIRDCLLLL